MKRIFVLVLPILLLSCEVNFTKKKDLITEIEYQESGLVSDDVYTLLNGKKEKRNQLIFGEKLEVVFNGVAGFKREEGIAYPGLELIIVSENEEDTLFFIENALPESEEGIEDSPLKLEAFFINTLPINKYKLFLKGYDMKGDGFFNFYMPFEIIKNERISVMEYGLKTTVVYLYDETADEVISDNIVYVDHKLSLIVNEIQGLSQKDSMIYPSFSLEVTDVKNNVIIDEANLFQNYQAEGVRLKDVEQQVNAFLQFSNGQLNNPYKVKATFRERSTGKKIDILTFLNIIN